MVDNDCRHVYKTEVKAFNVGCMKPWINYEPKSLKEIMEKHWLYIWTVNG